MDNVTINSLTIQSLRANRDATNSTVTVSRSIQNLIIGGNVENTNIQAGYQQSLFADIELPLVEPVHVRQRRASSATPPPTITDTTSVSPRLGIPRAPRPERRRDHRPDRRQHHQLGDLGLGRPEPVRHRALGGRSTRAIPAGPTGFTSRSGRRTTSYLPRGVINMKFEGTVNNSTNPAGLDLRRRSTRRSSPEVVHIKKGPVIPPSVPYQPYVAPTVYHRGQNTLKGLFKIDHIPSNLTTPPRIAQRRGLPRRAK